MVLHLLPNILTISRIVMAPVIILCMLKNFQGVALFLFACAALTDFFDGYLARRHNWPSALGNFLDPLADKILVLSLFVFFAYKGIIPGWGVAILVLRDILVTVLRVKTNRANTSLKTSRLGKLKTSLQFLIIGMLFCEGLSRNSSFGEYLRFCTNPWFGVFMLGCFYLMVFMATLSCLAYLRMVRCAMKSSSS